MTRFKKERIAAALEDLCRCPGLYAHMYEDLNLLAPELVEYRYPEPILAMIGVKKAWPTDAAFAALEALS